MGASGGRKPRDVLSENFAGCGAMRTVQGLHGLYGEMKRLCSKEKVAMVDLAPVLEKSSFSSGKSMVSSLVHGITELFDMDIVKAVVCSLDGEDAVPAKDIARRYAQGADEIAAIERKPRVPLAAFVNDSQCVSRADWKFHKRVPYYRRCLYRYLTCGMLAWFRERSTSMLYAEKTLILDNMIDLDLSEVDLASGDCRPYVCYTLQWRDGSLRVEKGPGSGIVEGELVLVWHMINLGLRYDYYIRSIDIDLILLAIMHSRTRGDSGRDACKCGCDARFENHVFVVENVVRGRKQQKRGGKQDGTDGEPREERTAGVQYVVYDINAMVVAIENSVFGSVRHKAIELFVAAMISCGNDFVTGFCPGANAKSIFQGWTSVCRDARLGERLLLNMSYEAGDRLQDPKQRMIKNVLDYECMEMVLREVYRKQRESSRQRHSFETAIQEASGVLAPIICNIQWVMEYWANQPYLKFGTRHRPVYSCLETCRVTKRPLWGYKRDKKTGLVVRAKHCPLSELSPAVRRRYYLKSTHWLVYGK
jgi:hypothetical protein